MKFQLYQIAVFLISAAMIYQGIAGYIKGMNGQTLIKLSARIVVWGGMTLIAIYPNFTNILAKIIGIEGNINAVILIGFLFIFLLIFKLLSAIEKLERDLSTVTRNDALGEMEEK